jgi:hypothetical protein
MYLVTYDVDLITSSNNFNCLFFVQLYDSWIAMRTLLELVGSRSLLPSNMFGGVSVIREKDIVQGIITLCTYRFRQVAHKSVCHESGYDGQAHKVGPHHFICNPLIMNSLH